MPRPIWSGAISFGLVSIPVKLVNAVSRKTVSFNQIDARTGSRIKLKKVSATDGADVPEGEIVKGYEISKDRYVIVRPDELEALEAAASRAIEIEEFVDLDEIDPVFYDASYYLLPDKSIMKPYALLVRAMEASNKVGIARFVRSSKEYLAAIRAADGHLVLSTMVYADEVVDPASIPELEEVASVDVSDRELAMAGQLVESLAASFEPGRFHDTYRDRVLDLIERKAAAGDGEVELPVPAPSAPKVVDLLAALEASVKEAKAARTRHPSAGTVASETSAEPADAAVPTADADTGAAVKPARAPRRKKTA